MGVEMYVQRVIGYSTGQPRWQLLVDDSQSYSGCVKYFLGERSRSRTRCG